MDQLGQAGSPSSLSGMKHASSHNHPPAYWLFPTRWEEECKFFWQQLCYGSCHLGTFLNVPVAAASTQLCSNLCLIGIFWFSCFFPGDCKWTWWSRRWKEHVSVGTGLVWSTKFNFISIPFCKDLQILPNYSKGCKRVKKRIKTTFSFRRQKLPRRQLYLTCMGEKIH